MTMAALKELKERIASVQSTLKITSAMKMVASAKLMKVQSSMVALSEYERRFSDIVAALVSDPDVEVASPLTLEHGEKRRACLVALASDSSLCGAFNANALREAVSAVEELLAGGFSRVTVYPMGEKMVQGMGRYAAACGEKIDLCLDYRHLVGKHSFDGIIPLADRLMEDFLAGRCDRVCISRCHFHSMGRQVPMREQLLPFNRVSRANVDRTTAVDYILEPAPDTLLDALLPSAIRIILYNALLDSITAENAARMVAMQTATDNAEELSDDLTLEYNKRRQQAITSELADITSSSEG